MLLWALEDYEGGEKTNKNKKELNFHLKNDLAGKGVDAVKGWFKKFLP
jgi:hypothetical protein